MSAKIGFNTHGKGRVRVVKVTRQADGTHQIQQLNVQILLEGDVMDGSFYTGDNANVVPTDTCKNSVYCLAKMNDFASIEDFGMIICRHFLTQYPECVNKINVKIVEDNWERLTNTKNSDGKVAPHKHTFRRMGPKRAYTNVQGEKRPGCSKMTMSIQSGFTDLEILKTTQSGFVGYHRCRFTSLPESKDRLLGTSVSAEWVFNSRAIEKGGLDFKKINANIENNLVSTFAGPSDIGVYSPSVQQTLWDMGRAAVNENSTIDQITLLMPNIHNIAFNLETYGLTNKDHTGNPTIFFPIDEPHGMIKAVIERDNKKSRL